jgi:hypothetical protein
MLENENMNEAQKPQLNIGAVMAMLPIHGTHKTLGRIEILGVRVKSNTSNNTMYMTIIDGDMLWVYDYETELDFTKKDYDNKILQDFTPKIYEWIMKPPFNLEHAQHGMACEKFGDVRADFLRKLSLGN